MEGWRGVGGILDPVCPPHNTLHAISGVLNGTANLTKTHFLPDLFCKKKAETYAAEEISAMNVALVRDLGTTFFIRKYHVWILILD